MQYFKSNAGKPRSFCKKKKITQDRNHYTRTDSNDQKYNVVFLSLKNQFRMIYVPKKEKGNKGMEQRFTLSGFL